jgi:hypothetical protein
MYPNNALDWLKASALQAGRQRNHCAHGEVAVGAMNEDS